MNDKLQFMIGEEYKSPHIVHELLPKRWKQNEAIRKCWDVEMLERNEWENEDSRICLLKLLGEMWLFRKQNNEKGWSQNCVPGNYKRDLKLHETLGSKLSKDIFGFQAFSSLYFCMYESEIKLSFA